MDIRECRQQNFQWLFQQFKQQVRERCPDEPDKGMLKQFATKLSLSERYASHINNDRKAIGSATARKMEKALRLEHGWMDREHGKLDPQNKAEREFLQTAIELFRMAPIEAQAALLRQFRDRVVNEGEPQWQDSKANKKGKEK